MNGVIPREQAFANARRVLDAARQRRDRDRAAGRLAPEVELLLRRLERQQRTEQRPAPAYRPAA
ncbi:hypothetical protein [Streptomyces sp. BPTC-684]|uniref:hypothetical protein n=1 Tax=Streptomyces sp. BPTC-684 TaxID=3043734 RepID=UPI0024B22D20|nr:hypothetical protein [Streptomyces sp. BPTC-684]WHM36289.1 hypothetical protein QIY60_04665 [Streptomyces sp. BPTC-684]